MDPMESITLIVKPKCFLYFMDNVKKSQVAQRCPLGPLRLCWKLHTLPLMSLESCERFSINFIFKCYLVLITT